MHFVFHQHLAGYNRKYLLKFIESGYDDIRMMEFVTEQILLEEIGFQNQLSMNLILHRVEWLKESIREFKNIVTNKLKLPKRYLLLFNEQGIVNMEYLVRFAGDKAALQREIGITVNSHLDALCGEMNLYQMGRMSMSQLSEGADTELSYQPGANGLDNTPGTPNGCLLGNCLTPSPAISGHSGHSRSLTPRRLTMTPRAILTSPSGSNENESNLKMFHETKGDITNIGDDEIVAQWKKLKDNEWMKLVLNIGSGSDKSQELGIFKRCEVMMEIVIHCFELLVALKVSMTADGALDRLGTLMVNIESVYEMIGDEEKENELQNKDLVQMLNNEILKGVEKRMESMKITESINITECNEAMGQFVVRCCSVLWSVVEREYDLFPKTFAVDDNHETLNQYNPSLHEREQDSDCNAVRIRYCTFPAIVHDGAYLSKMYVICME